MCGIAGYLGKGDRKILEKMIEAIKYRGPDKNYFWDGEGVGVAHNRLSIVGGSYHSIIKSEDGDVVLACNGEIYNYRELKNSVKNYSFQTETDTEVLVHLYKEHGVDFLKMLNGMFALALYDKKEKTLLLARDRTGQKPLYWGLFNETFLFGSEIKSVVAHPSFKKEIDLQALNEYLLYEYIPSPKSIFKGLEKVIPGGFVLYKDKKIEKGIYRDYTFSEKRKISVKKGIEELDKVLERGVDSICPEKDFSIFLSGGVDSSALTYYAKKVRGKKFNTLSVDFEEKSFNESGYAKKVAKHLDIKNYQETLSSKKALVLTEEVYSLLDEPLADMALIPGYFLSKMAKKHTRVCLGGDGMDELMCGYDTFIAEKFANLCLNTPYSLCKKTLELVKGKIPVSRNYASFDYKVKKFVEGLYRDPQKRHHFWMGSFDRERRKKLLTKKVKEEVEIEEEFFGIEKYWERTEKKDYLDRLIYEYLKTYLADDILTKLDRVSMYNSVEARSPFLEDGVVDFVNSLPTEMKMRGFSAKFLLKETLKNNLPREIVFRKKKGFGVPIGDWINGDFKKIILFYLSQEKVKRHGFFEHKEIEKIIEEHLKGKENNYKLIWTLFVFQYWFYNFYEEI